MDQGVKMMSPIVRHPVAGIPVWLKCGIWLLLTLPTLVFGADRLHLLGFVERLCADEPYCFELRVKPAFVEQAGENITVRYAAVNSIYDPENYELTLAQQNIVPGSHLRLLLSADKTREAGSYQANVIWIGD